MSIKKLMLISLAVLSVAIVQAMTVATVDGRMITSKMVQQKVRDIKNAGYSTEQNQQQALEELINEALLLNYAAQNQIRIDQIELDAFFFSQLGDHPRFSENGIFSKAKYENFKYTTRAKTILDEMRKELLLSKTRELIEKDFNLTDTFLYQKYLIENRDIEINYAIIDIDKVNIPLHYTVEGARRYYQDHRSEILQDERIKLEFYYFPVADYWKRAESFFATDTTYTDSLNFFIQSETRRLAKMEAETTLQRIQNHQMIKHKLFSTEMISQKDHFGIFEKDFIAKAFAEKPNDFSSITETPDGFILYAIVDSEEPKPATLEILRDKVWSNYIKDERVKNQQLLENVFIANIDRFITPATVVQKIYLGHPSLFSKKSTSQYQKEQLDKVRKVWDNDRKLNELIKTTNLKLETTAIYQGNVPNSDPLDQQIAAKLDEGVSSGVVRFEHQTVIFKSNLHFPEYIPSVEDVMPQLQELLNENKFTDVDLLEYFEKHKKDFATPDSLKLAICYFDKDLSESEISEEQIQKYYDEHNLYSERSADFNYIFITDHSRAVLISDYAKDGSIFELLKKLYQEKSDLAEAKKTEYNKLPQILADNLKRLAKSEVSSPISYKNGWLVIKKHQDFPAGVPSLEQIKDEIITKLKAAEGEKIAYQNARTVFDSTRYFSQSYQFASNENIIKTSLQNADDDFEVLGNISEHRKELLRIWRNEKYSRMIETENGFAVVYLLKKVSSKALNFQEAKPQIKQVLAARDQIAQAKRYTDNLVERIKNGADANRLLYFISEWQHAAIQQIDTDLFRSRYSETIIKDITRHEAGYFSPVVKLEDERFLFFEIDQMKIVDKMDFLEQKKQYRQQVIDEQMEKWYQHQASLSKIEK